MNLKYLVVIIGIFIISCAEIHGQTLMFNWAKSGLKVRDKPDINGNAIGLIPFGGRVYVQSLLDNSYPHIEVLEYSNNQCSPSQLNLSGYWLEIAYKNILGYVWSGYLSRLPAIEWKHNNFAAELNNYFIEVTNFSELDPGIKEMQFEIVETQIEGEGRIYVLQLSQINMTEAFLLANIIGGIIDAMKMDDYPLCFSGNMINGLKFKSNQQSISIQQLNTTVFLEFSYQG